MVESNVIDLCWVIYSLLGNFIIGKNELSGSIPTEYFDNILSVGPKNDPACRIYRNVVNKLRLDWVTDLFPSRTQFLSSMQILSLRES